RSRQPGMIVYLGRSRQADRLIGPVAACGGKVKAAAFGIVVGTRSPDMLRRRGYQAKSDQQHGPSAQETLRRHHDSYVQIPQMRRLACGLGGVLSDSPL